MKMETGMRRPEKILSSGRDLGAPVQKWRCVIWAAVYRAQQLLQVKPLMSSKNPLFKNLNRKRKAWVKILYEVNKKHRIGFELVM